MNEPDTKTDAADVIGDRIESQLCAMVALGGHHPDDVLAAALSRVMLLVTFRHGGDAAADAARRLARQCRGFPSHADNPLAGVPVHGSA